MSVEHLLSDDHIPHFLSFKEKFSFHNLSNTRKKILLSLRVASIIIGMSAVLSSSIAGVGIPNENVECMKDTLFDLTAGLNSFFVSNDLARHILLIFSSSMIDFQYIYFCVHFLLWGKSGRPIVFLVIFYAFRAFIQGMFMMKFPEGMVWDYPGIPSITISYGYTSDFFFSGHVGIMTFITLEHHKHKNSQMMGLAAFGILFEFFTMVVLRGHYSIDLFSGIIFGHYFWMMSKKLCKAVDKKWKIKSRDTEKWV